MRDLRGSAIVFAMLLLILVSGLGMIFISLPFSAGESSQQYHQAAVMRNVASAGAHAAIASLPGIYPEQFPRIRRLAAGPNLTGKYTVSSRKSGSAGVDSGKPGGFAVEEYTVISEGEITEVPGRKARVTAVIRYGPSSAEGGFPRARIRKWEEEYVVR